VNIVECLRCIVVVNFRLRVNLYWNITFIGELYLLYYLNILIKEKKK